MALTLHQSTEGLLTSKENKHCTVVAGDFHGTLGKTLS